MLIFAIIGAVIGMAILIYVAIMTFDEWKYIGMNIVIIVVVMWAVLSYFYLAWVYILIPYNWL